MKKLFFILTIFVATQIVAQNNQSVLIPQPVTLEKGSSIFELTKSTTISINQKESEPIATMLAQKLSVPTGFQLDIKQGNSGNIQLNINEVPNKLIGVEGYTLEVTSKGVIISANKAAGIFYGVQTLLQLLPNEVESKQVVKRQWFIPEVKITDYPRFAWRGVMLDVSRHFFTKEEVKRYIDDLARLKINTFHWHLTDDNGWRIEIKSLPKLTEIGAWRVERSGQFGERSLALTGEPATYGGFYTQSDIKEVVQYAKDRHIIIVPEIDVPGHSMAAIAAYPELCCTKDTTIKVNPGTPFAEWYADGTFKMLVDNTLNPSDEKVYEFLDKVLTEVAALFPGEYIHVGGDECYKGYWANDPGCVNLMKKLNITKVHDLQVYFMNRVNDILKTKGKKMIGWDEEGELAPDAAVMSWRGFQGGIDAAKKGHNVVMCPASFVYLDFQQGERTIEAPVYASLRLKRSYEFEPVPDSVDAKYIMGGQGNLWTENVPNLRYAQYMTFPRIWALSEVFWSPKESRNWEGFIPRVENQLLRADMAEINVSRAIYDPIVKTSYNSDKLWVEMESEAPHIDIFYTIDGTMPDTYSLKYTNPMQLPDGPITLRVRAYRNNKPIGHLIILNPKELKERAGK